MTYFFVPFAFFSLLLLSVKKLYVFALDAANSFIILPPNSSFNNPVTFLFFSLQVMAFLFANLKHQILFQHLFQHLHSCLLFSCRLYNCLFPGNINLFFLHILVSQNHTKTHTVLFALLIILIDLSRMVYSYLPFHFYG